MFNNISEQETLIPGHEYQQTRLMLNGYSAIQYCNGKLHKGSYYTVDTQLIFIKNGTFRIRYGNVDFEILTHQFVLLKKNIWIEYMVNPSGNSQQVEYVQFTIKDELVKEFAKLAVLSTLSREEQMPVLIKEVKIEWLNYMGSLDPYLKDTGNPEAGLVKLKMLELFFHLFRMDKSIVEQLLDIREHFRTNITAIVEDNIMNSISMVQLAALSGRSLSSFRRDFLAIYNMPPSQWIRYKRLEKARELLLSTTMTVTAICHLLGFENMAHFSRLFKSHFGYSPSGYKLQSMVA